VRVIGVEKANNLPPTEDLRFVIEGDELGSVKVVMLDAAEVDRRSRSWRTPPPAADDAPMASVHHLGQAHAAGPVPQFRYAALYACQRPWDTRPAVEVLATFPGVDRGARLARMRCEQHASFRREARWQDGEDGGQLSRYTAADGTVIRFAVAPVAS
jgi:hypothetical protein